MTFKPAKNQLPKTLCRLLLKATTGLFLFLILSPSAIQAERITVNVVEWTPVITEFQIDRSYTRYMRPAPEWTRVESQHPTIPSAWETLKDMVKIKLRGQWWGEDEPVIGGWTDWTDEEGASGIEVMRSDKAPEDGLPLYNFLRQDLVIRLKIEIWGRYRFPDDPSLGPADQEYQDLIKEKIKVREFSLGLHKVEGELSLRSIKNGALPDPFKILREDYDTYLSDYENLDQGTQIYAVPFRGETGHIGEIQLKIKLFFPEVDEAGDTWRPDTPLEAYLRYISAKDEAEIRKIHEETRRQ